MLTVLSDGSVYPCCTNWLSKPAGNILKNTLLEIWNGPTLIDIRKSILDESFRYCTKCPFLPGPRGFVVQKGQVVPSPDRIGILKLDYDQSCNLICRGCRTQHSSQWVRFDNVKTIHTALLDSDNLKHADQLYITGAGDPFASPSYWELLKNLPKLAPNPRTRVLIHTNGLLLTPSNWKRLGETARRIEAICISIDASCPETYATNRGGSWDVLMKNLSFIASIHTQAICLILFFVVQLNNFMEMPAFVLLGNKFSANHINFVALQNWGTFGDQEYLNRAVHLPSHPQHNRLLEIMRTVRSMKTRCSITPLDVIADF